MKRKSVQNAPIEIYCTKREKLWKKCGIEGVFWNRSVCQKVVFFLMKNWTSVTSDPSKKVLWDQSIYCGHLKGCLSVALDVSKKILNDVPIARYRKNRHSRTLFWNWKTISRGVSRKTRNCQSSVNFWLQMPLKNFLCV